MGTLIGQRVVVTRAREQASVLAELLEREGAEVVLRPAIMLSIPAKSAWGDSIQRLRELADGRYDALIVTSTNGVDFLAQAFEWATLPLRSVDVFAVGPRTAERLRTFGVEPICAEHFQSEGLVETIVQHRSARLRGARFLLARAREGRDVLIQRLQERGARVDTAVLYETRPVPSSEPLPTVPIDWVTFTSPSTVDGFLLWHTVPEEARVACLGPVTRAAAEARGLDVHAVARTQEMEALVEEMRRALT